MNDRRQFLRTLALAPVGFKALPLVGRWRIVQRLTPQEVWVMLNDLLKQSIAHERWTEHWDDLRFAGNSLIYLSEKLEEPDNPGDFEPYIRPGQYVSQLIGRKRSNDTHFYSNVSFYEKIPLARGLVELHYKHAAARFESWSTCDCSLTRTCVAHGGATAA